MSEIIKVALPEVPGKDVIAVFNNALLQMDDYRVDLYEQGDYESLSHGLANLVDFRNNLTGLIQAIETNLYEILPEKKHVIEGLGTFEKRRGSSKKWDSEKLINDIVRAKLDNGTGEISPTDVFELIETLKKVLPLTQSLGWRVTALREENIDTEQYCDVVWGRPTISIQWNEPF
jgi:hypothetical protein